MNYFPPRGNGYFPPRVEIDSCHSCGHEMPISALRQDWKEKDGKHDLVLECEDCWQIRMGYRPSFVPDSGPRQ